ncbi:MAG: hypothetical protein RLZZ292_2534 [Bacteroidota bacterium]|jgi:hypothetical protein
MIQAIDNLIRKPKTYTLHEYLAREERSLHKHEFHNGQIAKQKTSSQYRRRSDKFLLGVISIQEF